eukprot:4611062-Amphidinium_carterae.1
MNVDDKARTPITINMAVTSATRDARYVTLFFDPGVFTYTGMQSVSSDLESQSTERASLATDSVNAGTVPATCAHHVTYCQSLCAHSLTLAQATVPHEAQSCRVSMLQCMLR